MRFKFLIPFNVVDIKETQKQWPIVTAIKNSQKLKPEKLSKLAIGFCCWQ